MRALNFEDYVNFTFKDAGFTFTTGNYYDAMQLLSERGKGVVYGIKTNGDVAILDSRQ